MKRENHFMKQNNQSYIGYIAFVVGGYIAIYILFCFALHSILGKRDHIIKRSK
jgi:hypothetical protein